MPYRALPGMSSCEIMSRFAVVFLLSLAFVGVVGAEGQSHPAAEKYELKLIHIFEDGKHEFIFTVGNAGFRSLDSLKRFLGSRPSGTEIRWAPGCIRFGGEPLLSSEEDMKSFKEFLEQRGIKFVLIPSG